MVVAPFGIEPAGFLDRIAAHERRRLVNQRVAGNEGGLEVPLGRGAVPDEPVVEVNTAAVAVYHVYVWVAVQVVHGERHGARGCPRVVRVEPGDDFTAAHRPAVVYCVVRAAVLA